MAREVTFTDPGEGIFEAEIVEVAVSVGDHVDEGDTLLVVETDKATTDLPSPYTGEVEEVAVSAGDVVEVGDVLLTVSGAEDAAAGDTEETSGEDETDGGAPESETSREQEPSDGNGDGGRAAAVGELPEQEPTSGDAGPSSSTATDHIDGADDGEDRGGDEDRGGPVPASPATRRRARELQVDLAQVEATGEDGRVTRSDIEAAAEDRSEPAPEDDEHERWGPVERVRLRGVRRTTARRVAASWQQIPHVTHHDVLDVTALERWRREQAPRVEEAGGELTLLVLVMKAVAGVLARHPRLNASLDLDAEEVVLKRHYHLAIAVDSEDGLLVPVVRDVDHTPLLDLAVRFSDLVARTRARDLDREELGGGTFTITNIGPLGGTGFTPLIQPPQVAILGMGRARLEQVVTGDLDAHRTEVQLRLPISLAYDHRVVDGADAARFVADLATALADPNALLLTT
ncbi:MAG: dihydrolipoamide acetyltransferase family protein [Nitriliruptoraceae bacterium]